MPKNFCPGIYQSARAERDGVVKNQKAGRDLDKPLCPSLNGYCVSYNLTISSVSIGKDPRMTKRLIAAVSNEEAHLLKTYAAMWGLTLSSFLREAALQHVWTHSTKCGTCAGFTESVPVPPDKRRFKTCYSCACRACKHETACRAGVYFGSWEISPEFEGYRKPENLERIEKLWAEWEETKASRAAK